MPQAREPSSIIPAVIPKHRDPQACSATRLATPLPRADRETRLTPSVLEQNTKALRPGEHQAAPKNLSLLLPRAGRLVSKPRSSAKALLQKSREAAAQQFGVLSLPPPPHAPFRGLCPGA